MTESEREGKEGRERGRKEERWSQRERGRNIEMDS